MKPFSAVVERYEVTHFGLNAYNRTLCYSGDACNLVGWEGLAVQVAITVFCAGVLVYVWWRETPRRPFLDWAFDISKQVIGSAYGKLYNINQAMIFSEILRNDPSQGDACVWYLMIIISDCFLTTFGCWAVSAKMRPLLHEHYNIDIGDYSGESSKSENSEEGSKDDKAEKWRAYFLQLGIWLGIVTAVRLVVSVTLFFTQKSFYPICAFFLNSIGLKDSLSRLIFVVLIFPAFADTFQIVVQDNFLKLPQELRADKQKHLESEQGSA
eukprot:TRINITY_DN13774_c0_g1_i2.p1 TRINITY_DN13774_c0_g1~~TRINITY_DN13774_c0_g1_i2.p1  ORF type:complete len:268 (-),score=36.07 TRINITY_DN13774_c0_g1_i2:287-1090(-)